jgi:hypothetical protein
MLATAASSLSPSAKLEKAQRRAARELARDSRPAFKYRTSGRSRLFHSSPGTYAAAPRSSAAGVCDRVALR